MGFAYRKNKVTEGRHSFTLCDTDCFNSLGLFVQDLLHTLTHKWWTVQGRGYTPAFLRVAPIAICLLVYTQKSIHTSVIAREDILTFETRTEDMQCSCSHLKPKKVLLKSVIHVQQVTHAVKNQTPNMNITRGSH